MVFESFEKQLFREVANKKPQRCQSWFQNFYRIVGIIEAGKESMSLQIWRR